VGAEEVGAVPVGVEAVPVVPTPPGGCGCDVPVVVELEAAGAVDVEVA